ncbi:MAG: competence/damage-inducible protein A [Candidatus Alcyoniella australis]|nr:competence/damage-inducible protein A [Candidatus Alcyoniella australis]
MGPRAVLIATGAELVAGKTRDADSPLIAQALSSRGVAIERVELVGDDSGAITAAVLRAAREVELVVVTGGLGPTEDDLTSSAVAQAAGLELELDEQLLAQLEQRFSAMGFVMPRSNVKQAQLPQGAIVLPNSKGTAPGFIVAVAQAQVAVLPGPPFECAAMLENELLPRLYELLDLGPPIELRLLRTFGMTESGLSDLLRKNPYQGDVELGYKAGFPEILLTLRAAGHGALDELDECERHVRSVVGRYVYAAGEAALPEVVTRMLIERGQTLALAESCTGGLIAKLITDLPGSSAVFMRGAVTYTNRSKVEMLDVPLELIEEHGAVSEPVALAMARGIREQADADFGIGVTGIAGPEGGSEDKPVGTVWISLSTPDQSWAWKQRFPWDRARVRMVSAWSALERLRRQMLGIQESDS